MQSPVELLDFLIDVVALWDFVFGISWLIKGFWITVFLQEELELGEQLTAQVLVSVSLGVEGPLAERIGYCMSDRRVEPLSRMESFDGFF